MVKDFMADNVYSGPLMLASASPRRAELLAAAGYRFRVRPSTREEAEVKPEVVPTILWPAALALNKALAVESDEIAEAANGGREIRDARTIYLGADTIVVCAGEILNKPEDAAHARQMLRLLGGGTHLVITGVALVGGGEHVFASAVSECAMADLTDAWIDQYVDSELWRGRAGGYGIQDVDTKVRLLSGERTNVVGLPMELLARMLERFVNDMESGTKAGQTSRFAGSKARDGPAS